MCRSGVAGLRDPPDVEAPVAIDGDATPVYLELDAQSDRPLRGPVEQSVECFGVDDVVHRRRQRRGVDPEDLRDGHDDGRADPLVGIDSTAQTTPVGSFEWRIGSDSVGIDATDV